jgi:hypothetical protein
MLLASLASFAMAAFALWYLGHGGAIAPERTTEVNVLLKSWRVPKSSSSIEFVDKDGRTLRLYGDFNRFRLQDWVRTSSMRGPGPYSVLVDRETPTQPPGNFLGRSDATSVYGLRDGNQIFFSLADVNAWRSQERMYAALLLVMMMAGGSFLLWMYRRSLVDRGAQVTSAVSVAPQANKPSSVMDRQLSGRALSVFGTVAGSLMVYLSMVRPWLAARRHDNTVEVSTKMVVMGVAILLATTPYALFPRWFEGVMGNLQTPKPRARVFAVVVVALSFGVYWLFKRELAQIGYGF